MSRVSGFYPLNLEASTPLAIRLTFIPDSYGVKLGMTLMGVASQYLFLDQYVTFKYALRVFPVFIRA